MQVLSYLVLAVFANNVPRINIYQISNPSANPPLSPSLPDCTRDPLCGNDVCDPSKSLADRAAALVRAITLDEKAANLAGSATGSARLGLPAYQWQNEALHGVDGSTGVQFAAPLGAAFSAATSFPMPILLAAAFDYALVRDVAGQIGIEARAGLLLDAQHRPVPRPALGSRLGDAGRGRTPRRGLRARAGGRAAGRRGSGGPPHRRDAQALCGVRRRDRPHG
ncbi:glycoside hydrolase family 3 [Cordyceps fumosorosea ARSEF 2679]|uniref:Glycoside hydrolase family 3 n=1 Tax=Cordyceps fumosorosea (strain ARSEF 2679) TaxID=1081104 RepID=A0A167V792_CORFA|nr:glycoside hydrolase family 3 [Cordyceps fumosorosea ARSEF 2679]OAA62300.1 glycoside hydrolase family 3 [Cordyceps fumosorosea ARSEF 2679]